MATFSTILFHAHSGLRYLVLLVGIIALVYTAVAAARRRPWDSTTRGLLLAFTGLLDLQVLLGLVLVFVWRFYPALWGHILMMLLAVATAHLTSILNRRRPVEQRSQAVAAGGVALALVLIVGGIMAIGRSIMGSG